MQRQSSILSFFQKPSPENRNSGAGNRRTSNAPKLDTSICSALPTSPQVNGTDTPPEKLPRKVLFSNLTPDDDSKTSTSSVFSSILHKFAKPDAHSNSPSRNGASTGSSIVCSMFDKFNECKETPKKCGTSCEAPAYTPLLKTNTTLDQDFSFDVKSEVNVLHSETPPARPFVPQLKRIQEDCPNLDDINKNSVATASKRAKFVQESKPENNKPQEVAESPSKFEWLHPSRIRDANGRRPGDPFFDKRTLYIPPDTLKKMSASQKQYWSVKCQYMDVLLFFKVGKFYELYELDAEIGHKELDWKMTMSGVGKCRQVGISESGIDDAVQKLVARGYKVGRIEQLETSDQAKSRGANAVIPRKLVHVVTPSTTADDIGPDAVHLIAITEGSYKVESSSTTFGFAFVDCAALKIWTGSVSDDASCAGLMALLMQVSPKEIIYDSKGLSKEAQKVLKKYSSTGTTEVQLTSVLPVCSVSDAAEVQSMIKSKKYFKGGNNFLDSLLDDTKHASSLCALGGLITHLSRMMLDDVLRNGDILPYQVYKGCLRMDGQTLINLEVFHNSADGGSEGTLIKYLDHCLTHSGKRLLRSWICHPLKDVKAINNRLDIVEILMTRTEIMLLVAQYLRKIPDLERLLGRVKASVHSQAILLLPLVGKKTLKQRVKVFGSLVKGLRLGLDLLVALQNEHIMSLLLKILDLPELNGHDGLLEFLTQFEAAIDSDFPNYQDHEATESDAETLSILVELFVEKATQWSQITFALNCIDVLRSFTAIAIDSSGPMSRPSILPQSTSSTVCSNDKGPVLKLKGLWHPFALGEHGVPVPNDLVLGEDSVEHLPRTLLLTGPNMGGKSTLLRAVCVAVVLAQLGCYVPCDMCTLSVADIIFTRLGATDRIMTGESTFYIECAETASVLQSATQDSLVLLDELGRGTSTFDGYAIAYAVFRHLVEKVKCRLLFATHYHSLTKEFASHPHVSLQHMACAVRPRTPLGKDVELVFLYRLAAGACPESYGLQVALMAGIPKQVVEAASSAGQTMKEMVGESFKSSERRSEFSTLHENWLKTIASISSYQATNFDDDAYDTLFCLWHEVKASYT